MLAIFTTVCAVVTVASIVLPLILRIISATGPTFSTSPGGSFCYGMGGINSEDSLSAYRRRADLKL
jgi:hypothetical protein